MTLTTFNSQIPHFFNIYKDYFLNFEPANNLIAATLDEAHDATQRELRDFILVSDITEKGIQRLDD